MFKKVFVLILGFVFINSFFIFSQNVPEKTRKELPQKEGQFIKVEGPNLLPSVEIQCCDDKEKPCVKMLTEKGFIPVKEIKINVRNSGDKDSGSANGKVEFFDFFTNRSQTFNFTVGPIKAGNFGNAAPATITGPFLVKDAVKVSITFQGINGLPKTNKVEVRECFELW